MGLLVVAGFSPANYHLFDRLGISAPRGVLLHGHPGTGKTLVVRALAGACSRGGQQVSYFARKGADILGKYVGDSERQLRLLFQVAEQCQPAIIFFDEIDGLAPSRCGDRDQTQSSVVSTLLALMDGLSSRGSVVVIGATNRPDSLDPALRRPGRFDREIYFPLPSTEDRTSILRLHTRTWSPAPSPEILATVAKATPGFAGADLQALCVEAAMTALRRVVPLKYILDSAAVKGPLQTKLPSLPTIQVSLNIRQIFSHGAIMSLLLCMGLVCICQCILGGR
jgi:SpoVK/Ycf46/Vps4 family AAA+-type ATPase